MSSTAIRVLARVGQSILRRSFVAAVLLLVVSACGTEDGARTDGAEIREEGESIRELSRSSRLARDGIYLACGGAARSSTNPYGLRNRMWQSAEYNRRYLHDVEMRAIAIEEATSKPVRIVFHQPNGWYGTGGDMRGSVATVAMMNGRKWDGKDLYPWRWRVWAEELKAISDAHPGWILTVYFSGQMPTSVPVGGVTLSQGYENYDHDNARHRRLMFDVVDQWLKVGVDEFILDHTSGREMGPDMPELAVATRDQGGRLFVEAHPTDANGQLDLPFLGGVDGSLALHHFMVMNEPASPDWIVPEGAVMMVALTDHAIQDSPSRTIPTWSDVASYRERGFTILSGAPAFDHFVSAASATN